MICPKCNSDNISERKVILNNGCGYVCLECGHGITGVADQITKREKQEYELALKIGKRRFGSVCKHENMKNGYCIRCLRRVINQRRER